MDDSSDSISNNSTKSDTFTSVELEQFFQSRQANLSQVFQYLHEDVAQALRALTLAVPTSSETEDVKAFALETMQKVQEMAHILYPMTVVELGLPSALDSLVHKLNELYRFQENEELETKSRLSITTRLQQEPNRVTSLIAYGLLEIMLELFLERGPCTIDIFLFERPKDNYKLSIEVSSVNHNGNNCSEEIQRVIHEMDIRLRLTALGAVVEVEDNFITITFLNTKLQSREESGNDDL